MPEDQLPGMVVAGRITAHGEPAAGIDVRVMIIAPDGATRPVAREHSRDDGSYVVKVSADQARVKPSVLASAKVWIETAKADEDLGRSEPVPAAREVRIDLDVARQREDQPKDEPVDDSGKAPDGGGDQPPRDNGDGQDPGRDQPPRDDGDGKDRGGDQPPDPNGHGNDDRPPYRVYGTVRDGFGRLLDGHMVTAFDVDLRNEEAVGSSTTERGDYEIRYGPESFRKSDKGTADLRLRVYDQERRATLQTDIRFNAPADLRWDLTLDGAVYEGPSEWEEISADVEPLLDGVAPVDLKEDREFQDITFLAGETGRDRLTIARWIACFRLADAAAIAKVELSPAALYVFIRQGQPSIFRDSLEQDLQDPDRVALLAAQLLRGLGDLAPDLVRGLIETAITERFVPMSIRAQADRIVEALAELRTRSTTQTTFGGGKGTIGELLAQTPASADEQLAVARALSTHSGSIRDFWTTLADEKIVRAEIVPQIRLTFELGALTRNHVPLVAELGRQIESGQVPAKRDLARLDRAGWVDILASKGPDGQPIGTPVNIDGDTPAERMDQYAAILEGQFRRAYPTTAFSATLGRAEESPVGNRDQIVAFLDANSSFHLDRYRIDHYLADNPDALAGVENRDEVITDLKAVQRVFKLRPTYASVDALLSKGIDSAQQIYFLGQGQFTTLMADTGINAIETRQLYRRAEDTYARTLNLFGELNRALNGLTPAGLPTMELDEATAAKIQTLPNLATLFGSLDYCECEHCRSVYSPAAYFVDILRFLGERSSQGTTINAGKSVRQVLLDRRPDLGTIELSCDNTNTPLPYIDLVNEILEDVVSPPVPVDLAPAIEADLVEGPPAQAVLDELAAKNVAIGTGARIYPPDSRARWVIRDREHAYEIFRDGAALKLLPSRQSFLSAAELRANPEYTNDAAYLRLAGAVFPMTLPFDLPSVEVRAYLDHLGVPYPRLLELFQQRLGDDVTLKPTDAIIDAAWLNLSATELDLVTGTLGGHQAWDYWGLAQTGNDIPNPDTPADPTANVTGTWIEVLGHVNVFLARTGLEYPELLALLDTQFANPNGAVVLLDTIDPNAANCDVSTFRLQGLDAAVLDRMHRFIRLWRRLGVPMWQLDDLLPDADPDPAVVDKRIDTPAIGDLSAMSRFRSDHDLDWTVVRSLYHDIGADRRVDRSAEGSPTIKSLYERLFRNRLVDAVASFPEDPADLAGTIESLTPGILAAFRIKESELLRILDALGLAPTTAIDLAVLSRLHRVVVLARALGLTIDALVRLMRLSGADPFADPHATREFERLARVVADAGFSVAELDYLLAHEFDASSRVALDDKAIRQALAAIRGGLQQIVDDIAKKSAETDEAYVRSRLGRLPTLATDADQATALAIIDGTWTGTVADRNTLIDQFVAGVMDPATAEANLAEIAAGLTPAQRQAAVDTRFAYVQPELERFLVTRDRQLFVRQKVAELLGLVEPTAATLLDQLKLPASAHNLLATINDDQLLTRLADGSYQNALDEATFPDVFAALRLLHKDALVITRFGLKPDEVTWWLAGTHAADLGWMAAADLPIAQGNPVAIGRWRAMAQFVAWKSRLPASDTTAFEFEDAVLDPATTSAAAIDALAGVTIATSEDLNDLATAYHWQDGAGFDVVKTRLRDSAVLVRLVDDLDALRRLGVGAARAVEWASGVPTAANAEGIKQTVKAKYELAQWQQVIEPIQDGFREAKRDALAAWLIAHPDQAKGQAWTDTNGLYSYFLIDVEMAACMLTSRLKQAAASAQLFVQRCLLNLEVDLVASVDLDTKWKQWAWMSRYRVWEANRKVFLYPENWIEPELRDEKSPFFVELESELRQNDITNDSAEAAYLNYLEKLDRVANLEIRAAYNQTIGQDESVMHVFGRSRSAIGPDYFYRRRINGQRWTAWEKVDQEIASDHLVAGVHNRRLFLLWPQFVQKGDDPPASMMSPDINSSTPIPQPHKYWEIRLFWSELKKGKWTPKVLSNAFATQYFSDVGGDHPENVAFRARLRPQIDVRLYASSAPSSIALRGFNEFEKTGRQLTFQTSPNLEHLISPPASRYRNGLIAHDGGGLYFYYGSVEETGKPHSLTAHENAPSIRLLQTINGGNTYSVVDSAAAAFATKGTFFVWDPRRTYHVDYTWHTEWSYYSRAWHSRMVSAFQFFIHYHPFVELFIRELNIWGIKGLLNRRIQIDPASVPMSPALFNFDDYGPDGANVVSTHPVEDVDFSYAGAYSPYNWELFFHVPMFIANRLAGNQRFEEALAWYHYIFDPTNTDTTTADADTPQQRYWITKPFYETTKTDYYKQKIENILLAIAKGDAELRDQVREWRDNPFKPHLIARMRTVAYQKNVLIKYINTLIAWGDQLFRQDTIESTNEATQLYILAASILGPRPRVVPRRLDDPVQTFYQLQAEGIDDFGNALREIENLVAPSSSPGPASDGPELPRLDILYFCIPNNEKLLTLWDTVEDRLFKLRHCMNIEGVVRQLPLFDPPIDPALLVKAVAAGLDIGSAIADLNAPLPLYRFSYIVARALELTAEVKTLGSEIGSAFERRDAEALALLRSSAERIMLDQVRLVRAQQVDEALRTREALENARAVITERRTYFDGLANDGLNAWEITSLALSGGALVADIVATVLHAVGTGTAMIPEINAGASGFGGSPHLTVQFGGRSVTDSLDKAAEVSRGVAGALQIGSTMSATVASYARRADEWRYQSRLATKELGQIGKQILAAEIHHAVAEQELANQDRAIENAQKEADYLESKFTNQELYDWMSDQLSTIYFQSYQLAYDMAKRAERSLRYELGLTDSSYIGFGSWDSLRKGLLAGDRLLYDLRRLEAAYIEQNRREYELTKHVSLSQLDPVALVKLRETGECHVEVPEALFDLDFPGHYFRRLKTVALSVPCTVGPYTSVACTLTLTSNRLRTSSTLLAGKYARDTAADDPRFRDEIAAIASIATSSSQNDHGLFELNFHDDRYLPFEGAGAVSSWHIRLNRDVPQFDFSTISDVILHLSYTAREGGDLLRSKVIEEFKPALNALPLADGRAGLWRLFDLKREYADKWYRFLRPANPADDQQFVLDDLANRLPYFTQSFANLKVSRIDLIAQMSDNGTYRAELSPLGTTPADLIGLTPDGLFANLHHGAKDLSGGGEIPFGSWTLKLRPDGAGDWKSLPPDAIDELFLVVTYEVA